jgi:hypothetical protein
LLAWRRVQSADNTASSEGMDISAQCSCMRRSTTALPVCHVVFVDAPTRIGFQHQRSSFP